MTTATDTLFWACDTCQLPVHGRGGHICCRDREWFVVHRDCDPNPSDEGHWFPVFRATTAMGLLEQTARLHRWGLLTDTNWDTFIHRVLRNNNWEGRPVNDRT
jgi:hypothetical protein